MTKTKFKIEVNGNGDDLNPIIAMIANHNQSKVKIDLDVIVGFLRGQQAMLPVTRKDLTIKHEGHAPETIHISDDGGKTFYLTITECIYEELQPEAILQEQEILN